MKSRLWATEIYEESVNKYYIDILKETNLEIAISPLHDKDIYTEYELLKYKENNNGKEPTWKIGDTKKPHRHILLEYGNTTTYNNIKEIFDKIGGVGCIAIKSKRGYYEYLYHKNEDDKAKYNEEEIIKLNGFHIEKEDISEAEKEKICEMTITIINELQLLEYSELVDYFLKEKMSDYLKIIRKNTLFFREYMKSKRFYNQCKAEKERIDNMKKIKYNEDVETSTS